MTEENEVKQESPEAAEQESAKAAGAEKQKKDPVKRWTVIILIICTVLLFWYLRADRVTPMTSQARVHALVVPVAPEVSGTVTSVSVSNNQLVEAGQELFTIDNEQYTLAVKQA